jgi:deazaflavin-dependent oxidoreductase (nitroreductase family)
MSEYNAALINDLRAHGGTASEGYWAGKQLLILTTRGAKSGDVRESPLAFTRDGDRVVIVASKGGAPTNPAWYHNVVADRRVTVEVGGERYEATAEVHDTDDAERRRLYDQHAATYPGFIEYETKTDRVIPVIVLTRTAASAAA